MAEIRGVNLGGWFVLEQWMRPALFAGISGPDETVFSHEHPHPAAALEDHRNHFIGESDIAYLKAVGIRYVRLPVPWWFMGESPYIPSLEKLDEVIGWLEHYEIHYLIDLHTAPGCQNGFDNGGITNRIDWPKDPHNIDVTIEKLVILAKRYGKNPMFFGIEALNEPHHSIDMNLLQDFYLRVYHAIRSLTDGCVVFHDGFRYEDPSWPRFFKENAMTNVVFDTHVYYCFDPTYATMPFDQLIQKVLVDTDHYLQKVTPFVRVIVGEWSLGLNGKRFEQVDSFNKTAMQRAFAAAQLTTFEHVYGWFFWSYRIERESHREWDFRYLTEQGILPSHFE